ncbi:MAG TPA: helix-turn-helix transcriptional regulator [Ktedonobacteraceae bacterium]|jgi:transcriptional regulator with XRE-family HTH domain|nr:helix-turn-helix transcriptional regulator [Ktedonobacteraceae bacterium]
MTAHPKQPIELSVSEFGKLVRTYRLQRKWTQQQLADRWGHSREYVSQIERGLRKLDRIDQVNRLADILDIPAERLEAIGKGIPSRKGNERNTPQADENLIQVLLDPAQATIKLSWLVWHGDGDTTIIDNLSHLITQLEAALTTYRGAFRRQAQQLLAYAYEMMGKVLFDKLKFIEASGYFEAMLQQGEELKDPNLIALGMLHQGDLLRKRGHYELSIRRLEAAKHFAEASESFVNGMRWKILARTYSEYGLETPFLRAIDNAQEIAIQTPPSLDTKYNQFNLVEVLQERAQGHSLLWQHQKALEIYKETDLLRPFRPLRELGSYTIIKAQAHAYSGNLEEGIKLALKGLELAKQYQSRRHEARVQKMYDRLRASPLGKHPLLRDLEEALQSRGAENK